MISTKDTPIRKPSPPLLTYRDQDFTDAVVAATQSIWERAYGVIREEDWILQAPLIERINRLKKERGVVILAHNYQSPGIFLGVADFVGDSLELAKHAAALSPADQSVVMMCGVHFMAETVKILAPQRKVLIPDLAAGCSLAESITGADIRLLRQKYPGIPVVSYVNTSAEVKAETDACCTSSNAVFVTEAMAKEFGTDQVIFLPDRFLAANVAARTKVKIIAWHGTCMVHDQFTPDHIRQLRAQFPGARVLAHPECTPEVCAEADYVGSTSGMIADAKNSGSSRIVMVTECEMADNVEASVPNVEFVRPCVLCPHMQRITLTKILASLQTLEPEVIVAPELLAPARASVEKMLAISKGIKPQLWAKV